MKHIARGIAGLLLMVMASGCQTPSVRPGPTPARPTPVAVSRAATTPAGSPTPTGLVYRIEEGGHTDEEAPLGVASTTPLDPQAVKAVLARLPALLNAPTDKQAFALRPRSLPPPLSGRKIQAPFPPKAAVPVPAATPAGPLTVLRHGPEGAVEMVPELTVTFSQPMVPLAELSTLADKVPVTVTPQPPGKWRWLGTQTAVFTPVQRFPMATEYQVSIPAGTTSIGGGKLADALSWKFRTSPLRMEEGAPQSGPQPLTPVMVIIFNQPIEADKVLPTLHVRTGQTDLPLRLASAAEVAADDTARHITEGARPDRWLAVRAADPLPAGAQVTVTIGPGTPSVEGPLTTTEPQTFGFSTYDALKIVRTYGDGNPPETGWDIEFNNPLQRRKFSATMVHVEPAVPGLRVVARGQSLAFSGQTRGRTEYHVTLDSGIEDVFGQSLGHLAPLTFKVASAPASLTAPGGQNVILEPHGKPTYSIYTTNIPQVQVKAYRVTPSDWAAFQAFVGAFGSQKPLPPPGEAVFSDILQTHGQTDVSQETQVDLTRTTRDGVGQMYVVISNMRTGDDRQNILTWLQVTHIGLDALVDQNTLTGWASALHDGTPLAGVKLSLARASATTDSHGLARLSLPTTANSDILVASRGADTVFLPQGGWTRQPVADSLQWYVFDDRKLYRPAEDVHLKGWVRRRTAGPHGDIVGLGTASALVRYTVTDPQGNKVRAGQAAVDAFGGFSLGFRLPPHMNLGAAQVHLEAAAVPHGLEGLSTDHQIDVQEFRRPEFEVTAAGGPGPFVVGDHGTIMLNAHYYAGGGLPHAEVTWALQSSPSSFRPPHCDDYSFGSWVPWWTRGRYRGGYPEFGDAVEDNLGRSFKGHTDGTGHETLQLDFDRVTPAQVTTVTATASVQDVNRQAWSTTTSVLVHPSSVYVGLKSGRTFVQPGEPLEFDTIVTDIDGKRVAGRSVALHLARQDWQEDDDGEYQTVERDPQEQKLTSTASAVHVKFVAKAGGTYRLQAVVTDAKGRPNQSDLTTWVAGGKPEPSRGVEQQQVTLIPDRKTYRPGDTATILVQAPFSPAHGVMTLSREGIIRTVPFAMTGPSTTLKIPLQDFTPDVNVQVDLVGATMRLDGEGKPSSKLGPRPAFATGELVLSVPPVARTLAVKVTPQKPALSPGAATYIDVDLKDSLGHPVVGEVAVVVADEAVLALAGYSLQNPLDFFYTSREAGVSSAHGRQNVMLEADESLRKGPVLQNGHFSFSGAPGAAGGIAMAAAPPVPMPSAGKKEVADGNRAADILVNPQPQIQLRTNMNPLALFSPAIKTNAQGHARIPFKLPDNLTRYRIMAVAVAGSHQFGSGESALTARLPLMIRPSAPRFLNFGDTFELPLVIQNQTDAPMKVNVAMRATNIQLPQGAGQQVTVPANDRVEVRFPANTVEAGTARFQVAGVSGRSSDAASFTLPVWTPATTEAFATYGVVDEGGISQSVVPPTDVFPQFGGLEVTTSSTALSALTDALLYLEAYPYECAEQVSTRVLGVAALRDVLTAFKAPGLPTPEAMTAAMTRDIDKLKGMQNDDGGFGFWRQGEESWPYLSIHVAHALQEASLKGYKVPADTLTRVRAYLRSIESHIPNWYAVGERRAIVAYALNVRHLMGDDVQNEARKLLQQAGPDGLSAEGQAWLLPILTGDPLGEQIRHYFNNHFTETASAAHFATAYENGPYVLLASDTRTDAVVLDALIVDQPKSDIIPKIVRGLMDHREQGRWHNTEENVFVLLALDRYFQTYEKLAPDFVARLWLGDQYAGDHRFHGHTTERVETDIPMTWLVGHHGPQNLALTKTGPGRLYYRMGLQYAPKNLKMPAADYGFTVQREYQGVDKPEDVTRDADGTWHIKAGAQVRVKVAMVAVSERYHVALVDPLPAGLEAINPELVGSTPQAAVPPTVTRKYGWWWDSPWYVFQNLRDDRAEAFTYSLPAGEYSYTYLTRATTPGTFVVPPSKAEEMYHPETFGRSASDRVIVQ